MVRRKEEGTRLNKDVYLVKKKRILNKWVYNSTSHKPGLDENFTPVYIY